MKLALGLGIMWALSAFGQAAKPERGILTGPERADDKLTYNCKLGPGAPERSVRVQLTRGEEPKLDVTFEDGVRSRGCAVETTSPKEGVTYYYISTGGYPYYSRMTLGIKDDGKWARLTLATGAREFICEM